MLFQDGFDQITTNLAHGLDIHLSTEVTETAPGQVRLADGNRVAADRVVCSLPLDVLRSGRVRFAAPLARNRQAAIDGLRMGLLNKCWLWFDRIAGPEDVDWIGWLETPSGFGHAASSARILFGETSKTIVSGFGHAASSARIADDL